MLVFAPSASSPIASLLFNGLVTLYLLDILLLAIYGLYGLLQTALYWHRHSSPPSPTPSPLDNERTSQSVPRVTIQLPVYNERYVIRRLIEAVSSINWPADRLQVQILDDSTDETTDQIREILALRQVDDTDPGKTSPAELTASRPQPAIEHHHRRDRTGFKAGALQQSLADATGEFIAIFDADFVPPPDFLRRTIPMFDDATTGCVQARWGHLNPDTSFLTRAQAVGIDGHFIIEQQVRSLMGAFLNFNGTAGIWRRSCLEQAGGWQGDTLTEDLDLSYRIQLKGWRINYLPDLVVPAELPVQLYALKRQQFRWAKGSIQTTMKLWRALWHPAFSGEDEAREANELPTAQPLWRKLLGTLHLTHYAVHPLMLLNLLLILPIALSHSPFLAVAPLVTLSTLGPPLMYWTAMEAQGIRWPLRLGWVAILMMLGMGLSVNNSRAVLEALLGYQSEFQRTPKFAVVDQLASWQTSNYVVSGGWLVWVELLLGLYATGLTIYGAMSGWWWLIPWLALYAGGYGMTIGVALGQALQRRRAMQFPQSQVAVKLLA